MSFGLRALFTTSAILVAVAGAGTAQAQNPIESWWMLVARGDDAEVERAIRAGEHHALPPWERYMDTLVVAQFTANDDVARRVLRLTEEEGVGAAWLDLAVVVAASMNPSTDVVRALVEAGGSPNARYAGGWTPLHFAATRPDAADFIRTLVDLGADPDRTSVARDRPAVLASADHEVLLVVRDVLGDLPERGARFVEGVTPLMVAAEHATEVSAIEALLEAGADPSIRDARDRTAFEHTRNNELFEGPARWSEAYWTLNDARFD